MDKKVLDKIMYIGGIVVAGIGLFQAIFDKDDTADQIAELQNRISELEKGRQ